MQEITPQEIYEHKDIDKDIAKLPKELLKRYEKWKDIVRLSGVFGLKSIAGFKDEKLSGAWDGFRSSRLNLKYRVIYRVEKEAFYVKVIRITPHDYRRK